MATIATFTPADLKRVQDYVDQDFRPCVLGLARALARANLVVVPQYISSPTGLASTIGAPAADSVAALLASLNAGEIVPTTTGLALAGPLLASKVASYTTSLNGMLATYFSAAVQQDYAQIIGSPNLIA